ncbi:MAG: hypothetical protein IKT14_04140 [Clostridiales bacterium]|nr:hypothetical protein [Clostridiales bacterium]MBR6484186.1 hypothetical protein [Clostridiales bacterium]
MISLIIAGGILRLLGFQSGLIIFCPGVIIWRETVAVRITDKKIRHSLLAISDIIVLFMVCRAVRYVFPEHDTNISLFSWYLYSACRSMIAAFSFKVAYDVKSNIKTGSILPRIVFALEVAISIAVLTNNLHHLIYRFPTGDILDYTHGPLYILCQVFVWVPLASSFFILYKKCKITASRKFAWIPFIIMGTGGALLIIREAVSPDLLIFAMYNVPEIFSITILVFWEAMIQIGFLPTCSGYENLFEISSVCMSIEGEEESSSRVSRAARGIKGGSDHIRKSMKITGGTLVWYEDRAKINALKNEIGRRVEILSEENELISAENALLEKKKRYEVNNGLYNAIAKEAGTQIEKMEKELDGGGDLALCAVYGAGIKRKANLVILATQGDKIPLSELYLSIRDSMEYVKLTGAYAAVFIDSDIGTRQEEPLFLFDIFTRYQNFVEENLPGIDYLSVIITGREKTEVRMEISKGEETFYDRVM